MSCDALILPRADRPLRVRIIMDLDEPLRTHPSKAHPTASGPKPIADRITPKMEPRDQPMSQNLKNLKNPKKRGPQKPIQPQVSLLQRLGPLPLVARLSHETATQTSPAIAAPRPRQPKPSQHSQATISQPQYVTRPHRF